MSLLKPNEYHKNVTTINWKKLHDAGKRIVVFDIDNTLDLPDKETKVTQELKQFLSIVEESGFKIYFFSNNHEDRVYSFAKNFNHPYVFDAHKPFPKKYKETFNEYDRKHLVFVGDKIVTDVIGGNMYKSYTILVDPLTKQKKYWYTKIMSAIERVIRTVFGFKEGCYYEE